MEIRKYGRAKKTGLQIKCIPGAGEKEVFRWELVHEGAATLNLITFRPPESTLSD
jgi:hypothetical protein